MPTVPISSRQYQKLTEVNNQIAALAEQRQVYLELILDGTEVVGQNVRVIGINKDSIEYEPVTPEIRGV